MWTLALATKAERWTICMKAAKKSVSWIRAQKTKYQCRDAVQKSRIPVDFIREVFH
jgi:hypothetical protein